MKTFEWTFFPAIKHKIKTGISLFIIGFSLSVVYMYFGLYWTFFAIVILFFMLFPYFTPTKYKLDKDKIIIKRLGITTEYDWGKFRRLRKGQRGFLLSTLPKDSFLDRFRGVFFYLPEDYEKKKELFEFIEKQLKKNRR